MIIDMTAEEKADELTYKFMKFLASNYNWYDKTLSKQCAIIAIDELIKEQTMWQNGEVDPVLYWQEVKKEIENI